MPANRVSQREVALHFRYQREAAGKKRRLVQAKVAEDGSFASQLIRFPLPWTRVFLRNTPMNYLPLSRSEGRNIMIEAQTRHLISRNLNIAITVRTTPRLTRTRPINLETLPTLRTGESNLRGRCDRGWWLRRRDSYTCVARTRCCDFRDFLSAILYPLHGSAVGSGTGRSCATASSGLWRREYSQQRTRACRS